MEHDHPFHQRVSADSARGLARRWLLDPCLAEAVVLAEEILQRATSTGVCWPGLFVISGHRTAAEQTRVNPTQPNSLHRRCPSLAVDLRVGDIAASLTPLPIWQEVAFVFESLGVLWGGPTDQNHFYRSGTPVA